MRPSITLIMVVISGLLLAGCSKSPTQIEREKRMQNSLHYKDGEFLNPIEVPMLAPGSTWKMIKKYTVIPRIDPKPTGQLPIKPVQQSDWTKLDNESFLFAWLGHSSLLIAVEGKTILVDPVLEERASPFSWVGPKRFHPAPVTVNQLPPIDVVLITHDHYDHLEESTMRQLDNKTNLFLVPLGIGELLEEWGIAPGKIIELDWWADHKMGPLHFIATPALHYASRGLFDGNERLWCSWVVKGQNRKLFISGDSGYFDGFKKIGDQLGPFDTTFLKIGSYDETWKQIHMTPEEAVQQHLDLRGNVLVPLHWATFDLGLHPWYEPVERMLTSARNKEIRFITPVIGQQININRLPEVNLWWRGVDTHQE